MAVCGRGRLGYGSIAGPAADRPADPRAGRRRDPGGPDRADPGDSRRPRRPLRARDRGLLPGAADRLPAGQLAGRAPPRGALREGLRAAAGMARSPRSGRGPRRGRQRLRSRPGLSRAADDGGDSRRSRCRCCSAAPRSCFEPSLALVLVVAAILPLAAGLWLGSRSRQRAFAWNTEFRNFLSDARIAVRTTELAEAYGATEAELPGGARRPDEIARSANLARRRRRGAPRRATGPLGGRRGRA